MILIKNAIALFFVLLIFSCSDKKKYAVEKYQTKEIIIKGAEKKSNYFSLDKLNNKTVFSYIDYTNKKLIAKIIEDKETRIIPLDKLTDIDYIFNYKITSLDSVFLFYQITNEITLINSSGELLSRWRINKPLGENAVKDYCFYTFYQNDPIIQNNKIYCSVLRNTLSLNTTNNIKEFFKMPTELVIELNDTAYTCTNKVGRFPSIYQQGNSFYSNYVFHCINKDKQLVYSFNMVDSIFVCNEKGLLYSSPCKSKFITEKPRPFPNDSLFNFSYLNGYALKQAMYMQIYYNADLKLYYRIARHSQRLLDEAGQKNLFHPWSIIIMNDKLEVMDEIYMDYKLYSNFLFCVSPEGFIVRNNETLNNEVDSIKLYFFKLKYEN